jgi:hypothetical protein
MPDSIATQEISSAFSISLGISDPEVIAELKKHTEGEERQRYATGALKLGVLALRQAAGELDAGTIRNAAQNMLNDLGHLLADRGKQIASDVSGTLRQYFDPSTGALPQRIDSLVRNDGELDRALRGHLSPENSTISQAIEAHLGGGSPLARLLSPTDANGVRAQIEGVLRDAMKFQQDRVLREFSLDNKESALSRLVAEVTSSNGTLRTDLQGEVGRLASEFSLDKPGSALSRLMEGLEKAHDAIDNSLTLDEEGSPLSRMRRELMTTIQALASSNADFQSEVRSTLAAMHARKQEAARSTRHGHEFESDLGAVIASEAQKLNDPHDAVGATTGVIKNCKAGDFVSTIGPDSAARGVRVVWEAKEDASYTVSKALAEIETGRKNREAQLGIFVFSQKTAPVDLQSFGRYGNDILIVWDAENPETDIYVKIAYSVARALAIRESHESIESGQAIRAIDLATHAIENQLDTLEQIKTLAETVRTHGEKIADKVMKAHKEIEKQIENIHVQVNGLKGGLALAA